MRYGRVLKDVGRKLLIVLYNSCLSLFNLPDAAHEEVGGAKLELIA